MIRAPLMPIGWPRAMPPPVTFSRSRSNFSSRSQAITCAANASLISISSKSASVRPVRSRTFCVAGTGPMPMISGCTPAQDNATIRASGSRPSASARDSLISTIAAAPSVMPLELPAVTLPPSRKTGASVASDSMRGVGPRVLVLGDRDGLAPSVASTGNISAARASRRLRPCAGTQRELVLLLAGDVVPVDEVLGGLAHDQAAERVEQPVAVHRVDDLGVAHAGGRGACRAAGRARASCSPCRPRARPRLSPSAICCAPSWVAFIPEPHAMLTLYALTSCGTPARMLTWRPVLGPLPGLAGVPEDRLVDLGGVDAGAAQRLDGRGVAELDGGRVGERAQEPADRRARALDDDRAFHATSLAAVVGDRPVGGPPPRSRRAPRGTRASSRPPRPARRARTSHAVDATAGAGRSTSGPPRARPRARAGTGSGSGRRRRPA